MTNLLQYLALAYIHNKLIEIIDSTPMNEHREAYLWLIATQIPISMKNCSKHECTKQLKEKS